MSRELPGTEGGGLATYTFTMARALADRGHDVHVLSCGPGRAQRTHPVAGFTVHERAIPGWPWLGRLTRLPAASRNLRTAIAVRREVAGLGPPFDVVQVADFGAEGLLLRRGSACRVVRISAPSALLGRAHGLRTRTDRRFTTWMERRATRRADVVITPSTRTGEVLASMGWLHRPATLLRSPVDVDRWNVPRAPSQAGATIVAIGRVEHLKGIDRLVDAAALLSDVPGLRVLVAGRSNGLCDGEEYATWVARRAASRGVPLELLGAVDPASLPGLLAESRVLAMVSRFDNFPNAALEAMAAGRPVVCTSGTGVDEIVAGTEAGLVTPSDPASLASALRVYLSDPARADRAGSAARGLVADVCDPDAVAQQWERSVLEHVRTRL